MVPGLQQSLQGIRRRPGLAAAGLVLVLALAPGSGGAAVAADEAPPEMSEEEAEQELAGLRERIEAVRKRIEADRSERSEAEKRVEALDREIADLAAQIRRVETEQSVVREEIEQLQGRMAGLRDRLEAQKDQVARLAYSTYVMGRQSDLKLFLNQREPAEIDRMLGYHDYIVAARARTIEQINGWTAEIEAVAREQAARRDELESLAARRRAEQEALRERRAERESVLAKLDREIASSEDELSRLEENESRLEQILRELKLYRPPRDLAKGAFRAMQGKLKLPVSAPIAARYGERRTTGVRWDGIMLRPENGAEVSAIYEGRVVFADWLRGFGLLLIIDHGDGFMSLYSHNESLFKQLGDWVDTREVIGTVGTSGGLDEPGLYFEIRHDGEPQDPLSWCQRA